MLIVLLDSETHEAFSTLGDVLFTPFTRNQGITQLRVAPENSQPVDGDWVIALGTDQSPPPVEDISFNDGVHIQQEVEIPSAADFIKVSGRFRQPEGMPIEESVPGAEVTRGLTLNSSSWDRSRLSADSPFFSEEKHLERPVRITGPDVNNGTYEIFHVEDAQNAILRTNGVLGSSGGPFSVTADVLGGHWELELLFDGSPMFTFGPGRDGGQERDIVVPELALNVHRFQGETHTIGYSLKFVQN